MVPKLAPPRGVDPPNPEIKSLEAPCINPNPPDTTQILAYENIGAAHTKGEARHLLMVPKQVPSRGVDPLNPEIKA
jgi:hypothetical protein